MIDQFAQIHDMVKPFAVSVPRLLIAFAVLPLFPQGVFPNMLRAAMAISLSLGIYPFLKANMPPETWGVLHWTLFAVKEAFIGFVIAFAVGSLFWVLQSVGHLIDTQTGTSNASIFDPFGGHETGPLGAYLLQLGMAFFIAMGGLYILITLLLDSYRLWPPVSFVPSISEAFRLFTIGKFDSMLDLVTRLAAPAILILVLVELGIGLVNRVAPQLNVFFFSQPIKGATAVLILALMIAFIADVMRSEIKQMKPLAEQIDKTWQPRPPVIPAQ
jgi:type III secretion protein T